MGGRSFIVTQSIKKLSETLQQAVFNDCDYHLLSTGEEITLDTMEGFDKSDEKNRSLYLDKAYKVIPANNLIDLGLYEEKQFKNGNLNVFRGNYIGVNPFDPSDFWNLNIPFIENQSGSAPSFNYVLKDVITIEE